MHRATAALLVLAGCLQLSPHELPDERGLNLAAIEALAAVPAPEPLRFAVVGDVQRHSDEASDAVSSLNARDDLAFVVQVGDFTEYGLSFEFEVMQRVFARLRVPWLVAVGNHDLLGNGREIYERMFGPLDLAFTHGGVRFLLVHANALEAAGGGPVPDLAWVASKLAPDGAHGPAVVVAHVGPDAAEFDPTLRDLYWEVLRAGGAVASIHGHAEHFAARREGGILVATAEHVKRRGYLVLTARADGGFDVERVPF